MEMEAPFDGLLTRPSPLLKIGENTFGAHFRVKKRALKGIFLVRKWINNILKSKSVLYHMHHRKNLSFFTLVLGCARFLSKGPK